MINNKIKYIDLFAGIGGIRLGFEQACNDLDILHQCVMTSEIKPHAIKTLKQNFNHKNLIGDISQIDTQEIPDFDYLFAGFPCQPFSAGGKRKGFADTRGTLFFEIERILRDKSPEGFILENVEGLVKHDLENKNNKIGKTLKTILNVLENKLNYKVSMKVLDSLNFGVPQQRRRVYIIGTKSTYISLDNFIKKRSMLSDILEDGLPTLNTEFTKKLLDNFSITDLHGKSIKDKRGGNNNIHIWDIGWRGECSEEQKILLNLLLKERRKKHWAKEIGIDWMDGMPLTKKQISTFFPEADLFGKRNLKKILDDLVNKGYLKFAYPKKLVKIENDLGSHYLRVDDETKPKGYNIVTGKLSVEINKILDPNGFAPTLVATDMERLVVPEKNGLRKITKREGLRMFGFPDDFEMPVSDKQAYDLLGNSVVIPVIKNISKRIIETIHN